MKKSRRIYLQNNTDKAIDLVIEPWAREFTVDPGSVAEVLISYLAEGDPHVNFYESLIEIYLWKSCTYRIFIDNIEATDRGFETPHP